jgi:signal transduction histidine kinase
MSFFKSLRGRMAIISAMVIALMLTLAGFGLSWLFESYIERRVSQELNGRVLDLAGAFALDDKGNLQLTRTPSDPRYRNPYSGVYWYVREGAVPVLRSRSLWDAEIAPPANLSETMTGSTGPTGSDVYVLERPVTLGEGAAERKFRLGVALDKTEIRELSSSFSTELLAGLALSGLLLFAGAWLQASYGLRPLNAIRQQLSRLHQGERDRLDGPFPAEIEPLAQDLNTLFARQKDMITKARERSGSLAHGLKTPMTVLYGEARKLERAGDTATAGFMRDQLDLMQKQLDRELSRARAHGESAGLGLHADLSATAARLVKLMQRMPRGGSITWTVPAPGCHLAMDADDLGEVLGNLLDNARQWATSKVSIEATPAENGKIRVSISDDGPGVPAAFRSKVMERGETGNKGTGLGLAISSEVLAPYGATLAIESSALGGASLVMHIAGKFNTSP